MELTTSATCFVYENKTKYPSNTLDDFDDRHRRKASVIFLHQSVINEQDFEVKEDSFLSCTVGLCLWLGLRVSALQHVHKKKALCSSQFGKREMISVRMTLFISAIGRENSIAAKVFRDSRRVCVNNSASQTVICVRPVHTVYIARSPD